MKTQGWSFLTLSVFSFLFSMSVGTNAQAQDIKTVWLARITGQTQCANEKLPPALSGAIDDLEQKSAVVLEAKLGALNNKVFCTSCSCERNLYHVAKVNAEIKSVESAIQAGWTIVDPKTVINPSLPELAVDPSADIKEEKYELLPVVITE
jgi:hypothetical protein